MSLLVKGQQNGREIVTITPESAGWKYVGFAVYRLKKDEEFDFYTGPREVCIVILRGIVSIEAGDMYWPDIGERDSVFERISPYSVYVPHRHPVCITAHGDVEIAVCSAPGVDDLNARLIEPASAIRSIRGQASNTHYVCDILPQSAAADHLSVVEVITPGGHSSSYPPQRHEADIISAKSTLEQTYYHRINPSQGFVFQRVYTDDRSLNESMAVENHDVVLVPRGYHPVTAPHGYDSYYLKVMAGSKRPWHFKYDPAHDWLMSC